MAKQLTVWLSKSDDYDNFDEGVDNNDAFQLVVPSTNEIKWIEAIEVLFIGTTGDEWKIGTPTEAALTPTNFTIRQQSSYGSKHIQPVKVNETILFVDYVGRKIRELVYNNIYEKYTAPDLTALAEHITEGGVKWLAYQENPEPILWFGLNDGYLRSMTYEREQNVVACAKHPIDGTVQSGCVIPSTKEDEIWLSVKRTVNGEEVEYIEKFMPRKWGDSQSDCFFIDCGITYDGQETNIIRGLGHLEGETVSILGDGGVIQEQTVTNGTITFPEGVTAAKAQVGKSYTYKLEPMRPDIPMAGQTTHGSVVKVSEMAISFLNTLGAQYSSPEDSLYRYSLGAKYGTSDDELYEIEWRTTEAFDMPPRLFTGDVTVAVDGGFSVDNNLIISGSAPLPCTIRSMIPRMEKVGR